MIYPTQEEVVAYAAGLGVSAMNAATFYAHGTETSWTMKDGKKVYDWHACFRCWIEKMQGRAGFDIALHHKPEPGTHANTPRINDQEKKERQRYSIIRYGLDRGATDELIQTVLTKHGLSW